MQPLLDAARRPNCVVIDEVGGAGGCAGDVRYPISPNALVDKCPCARTVLHLKGATAPRRVKARPAERRAPAPIRPSPLPQPSHPAPQIDGATGGSEGHGAVAALVKLITGGGSGYGGDKGADGAHAPAAAARSLSC